MDWPRFWGQFSENIDQSAIAPVTKFSYLRELLEPKARQTIEALPFHSEGYNRAISILKDKFGKESEIVKGYTREILGLPTIQAANQKKIHEFSDKLSYCVQALETLDKLDGVNGAVPMTLDKLPSIRGDLVRTDPEWEKWTFTKLVEALNQWCRRKPIDKPSELNDDSFSSKRRDKLFHVSRQRLNPRNCVYCDSGEHKTNDCAKFNQIEKECASITSDETVGLLLKYDIGNDSIPPPVVTGSNPIPPPVVTGSDTIPPPVVTGSDPIPPPVVTGSDSVPPPVVTGSDLGPPW
ncbi:Hypothetical predicted protein [Paramuricea clavata]|uniref:Uncharacterized protein n=1 Tax=Paramuricea clavata TaxID=317549 RepID=A0A6S7I9S6_PARCT|nr:Hypothetical predicted protein [Paramuricea clavata]